MSVYSANLKRDCCLTFFNVILYSFQFSSWKQLLFLLLQHLLLLPIRYSYDTFASATCRPFSNLCCLYWLCPLSIPVVNAYKIVWSWCITSYFQISSFSSKLIRECSVCLLCSLFQIYIIVSILPLTSLNQRCAIPSKFSSTISCSSLVLLLFTGI